MILGSRYALVNASTLPVDVRDGISVVVRVCRCIQRCEGDTAFVNVSGSSTSKSAGHPSLGFVRCTCHHGIWLRGSWGLHSPFRITSICDAPHSSRRDVAMPTHSSFLELLTPLPLGRTIGICSGRPSNCQHLHLALLCSFPRQMSTDALCTKIDRNDLPAVDAVDAVLRGHKC